ncbi:MAG TPA: serine hydrolase [Gemmatimonadales bacterium]|nr:serine hydrolase [Gemmatimonadales bacterium]
MDPHGSGADPQPGTPGGAVAPHPRSWPYAAGSIGSTAGDLVIWNRALHGARGTGDSVLSAAAYREYVTPGTLNDGTRLRYAHGLSITDTGGRRRIAHGGGIYGYLSESRYYPDADLIIVVLINTAGPANPSAIADAIEEIVLGKTASHPERRFAGDLNRFVGTYEGPGRGQRFTLTVSVDSATLAFAVGNGRPRRARYVDGLTFAQGDALFTFVQRGDEIVELRADQVGGYLRLTRMAR